MTSGDKKKGKIIILSGPSGSGKTTLYKKILKDPLFRERLFKVTTATTRLPREKEQKGKDYIFLTRKQFFLKKKAGYFLESEKVFDNYYGTPKKSVQSLLRAGKNVLLCIDVNGAKTILKQFPRAIKIFVKAPSVRILKERLQSRGVESKEALGVRLKIARRELKEASQYHHVILNDELKDCYRNMRVVLKECLQ